jgi:hypothetical protein
LKEIIASAEEFRKIKILKKVLDFFGKLHLGDRYKTDEEGEVVEPQEYYESYEEYLKNAGIG